MKQFVELWHDAEGDRYDAILIDSDFIDLIELNGTSILVHVTNVQEKQTLYSREYPSKMEAHESYLRLCSQLLQK